MFKHPMRLDHRLRDDVPLAANAVKFPDSFGVEVELEGANVTAAGPAVMALWAPHADNSLRNHHGQAIEYVSKQPYNLVDTEKAITVLFDFLNSPGVKVFDSYRTSIHVHVNFGMETFGTIYNFITLSLILDELLVSQNGDHRIGNNFCLRAKDAMGQTNSLIQSIEAGNEIFGINQNERYSSINFASLLKFGSVEFRSLEGTMHKGRLMHWINTLAQIKKMSKEFKNPTEIISMFSKLGPKEFLFKILGPYSMKYIAVPGIESMLRVGMRIAQDFAYCSEWRSAKPGENTRVPQKRKVNKIQNPGGWAPNQIPQPANPGNWNLEPEGQ